MSSMRGRPVGMSTRCSSQPWYAWLSQAYHGWIITRVFSALPSGITALADWLLSHEVMATAMKVSMSRGHRQERGRGPWHHSEKGGAIFPGKEPWTATGSLRGARLLTIQTRKPVETEEGRLELDTCNAVHEADVLTNISGIHALTARRRYNDGAVVEPQSEVRGPGLPRPPWTASGATPSCGASPSWPTRRCIRSANTSSRAPGGRTNRSGFAFGCSGFPRS